MSRAAFILYADKDRERVSNLARTAPVGTRVEFKATKRSIPQNSLLWLRLSDISRQVKWYGQKLKPDDWKDILTAALRKSHVVPGIDPGTFVSLGLHTSDMTKDEMTALLDLIDCFAAEHHVKLTDQVGKE